QVASAISYRCVLRIACRPSKHVLRNIDSEHACGTMLPGPAAEPSEPAAEIKDMSALHIRQQRAQRRPFRRAVKAVQGAVQLAIPLEESIVIIDVVRHRAHRPLQ